MPPILTDILDIFMNEAERIQQLMSSESMTAKQFCEEVGIQSGTISNILSGRNRPSLDVMQKILNRFRAVSPDWLISGVGSMYRQKSDSQPSSLLFDIKPLPDATGTEVEIENEPPTPYNNSASYNNTPHNNTPYNNKRYVEPVKEHIVEKVVAKKISKIVVFYEDNTIVEIVNK